NRAEYFAGTSPRNAGDVLRLKMVARTPEGFMAVRWDAKGGVRYRVWSADRLTGNAADFAPVVFPIEFELETAPVGTSVERTFIDTRPASAARFYRIQVINE